MPIPVSPTAIITYSPGVHPRPTLRHRPDRNRALAVSSVSRAPFGHRIARVHREIQRSHFPAGSDRHRRATDRRPAPFRPTIASPSVRRSSSDMPATSAVEVDAPSDRAAGAAQKASSRWVSGRGAHRPTPIAAAERQRTPSFPVAGSRRSQHVEAADDHRQHVVEVVGDAAGQLADRLHLLRLAQFPFGMPATVRLERDPLLQRLVEDAQRRFGVLAAGDVDAGADRAGHPPRAVVHRCRTGQQGQRRAVVKPDFDFVAQHFLAHRGAPDRQARDLGFGTVAEYPEMPRTLGRRRAQRRVGILVEPQQLGGIAVAPDPARLQVLGEPDRGGHGFEQNSQLGGMSLRVVRRAPAQPRHIQTGADPRQQLARGKGLGHVIVGAGAKPLDPRLLARPSRQQDHRDFAQLRIGAHRLPAARSRRGAASSHRSGSGPAGSRRAAASAATPSATAITR